MHLQSGDVIGSYRVSQEVGRGGRAVVYRAWQQTTGRWVALKVLRRRDARVLQDFQREARLTANIGHGCVRKVYEVGRTPGGYPFLAMQFVDLSLRQLLRSRREQGRTFSREEVVSLLRPVADLLDYIHGRGLVHLDIKPENVLVFEDGQVVLADFGSACRSGTITHQGTPKYFSPEQAGGDRPVGPRSDVYSLAVVAYEMLTGRPPFAGERDIILVRQHLEDLPPPLCQAGAHLPPDVESVIMDALSKDPDRRPASAGALIDGIGRAEVGRPVGAGLFEWVKGAWRPWLWVPVGAASAVLIIGGFFIVRTCVVPPVSVATATSTPPRTPTATSSATPTTVPSATATATATAESTSTPRPTSTPTLTRPPATPTPIPTTEGEEAGGASNIVSWSTSGLRDVVPRKGEGYG
jgi:serine/threonine protein kinase